MQACTSLQTHNHASTPPLSFLQAGCPSCCPTNSVKALKANMTVQTGSLSYSFLPFSASTSKPMPRVSLESGCHLYPSVLCTELTLPHTGILAANCYKLSTLPTLLDAGVLSQCQTQYLVHRWQNSHPSCYRPPSCYVTIWLIRSKYKKGKVFPYSLPSVGPGADPGVQAVSPQVTSSESRHIPSSSLPLLSARPAFTFVTFTRWCYL